MNKWGSTEWNIFKERVEALYAARWVPGEARNGGFDLVHRSTGWVLSVNAGIVDTRLYLHLKPLDGAVDVLSETLIGVSDSDGVEGFVRRAGYLADAEHEVNRNILVKNKELYKPTGSMFDTWGTEVYNKLSGQWELLYTDSGVLSGIAMNTKGLFDYEGSLRRSGSVILTDNFQMLPDDAVADSCYLSSGLGVGTVTVMVGGAGGISRVESISAIVEPSMKGMRDFSRRVVSLAARYESFALSDSTPHELGMPEGAFERILTVVRESDLKRRKRVVRRNKGTVREIQALSAFNAREDEILRTLKETVGGKRV